MERLKCKACSSYSMVPMEVIVKDDDPLQDVGDHESRFYTCHVCGDNWLSVKETNEGALSKITFIHQMGMAPVLKRVAQVHTELILKETTVDSWSYFLDEDEVSRDSWLEKLSSRRKVLKSVCCN